MISICNFKASHCLHYAEEIIKVFRESTGVTGDLTAKLADILKKSVDYTAQVEIIREKALKDWNKHLSEVNSFTDLLIQETSRTLQRLKSSATDGASILSNTLRDLVNEIKGMFPEFYRNI